MEFVDNVTPQSGRTYWHQFNQVPDEWLWNKRDEQTARDYMSMYYQNAYNTALLNYQNEYNSPLQQMLRYQEAGINPFLASTDAGNMGSAPGGAAPHGSSAQGDSPAQLAQMFQGSMNQVTNYLNTAKDIYDYLEYGRPLSELRINTGNQQLLNLEQSYQNLATQGMILDQDLTKHMADAAWSEYWNYAPGTMEVEGSPRSMYMEQSTARISAQIEQLKSLVDVLYPSQKTANEARAALTDYQKQVLEGQNQAILDLDTGDAERDAILKQILFWLGNKLHF